MGFCQRGDEESSCTNRGEFLRNKILKKLYFFPPSSYSVRAGFEFCLGLYSCWIEVRREIQNFVHPSYRALVFKQQRDVPPALCYGQLTPNTRRQPGVRELRGVAMLPPPPSPSMQVSWDVQSFEMGVGRWINSSEIHTQYNAC